MANSNLVIYHYFERDASYRDNLLHFLVFGVLDQLDYIFIISGNHTVDLPDLPNVRYFFADPKKSDFGGYAQLIKSGWDLAPYENFFFINSSVRGPFMPPYWCQPWYMSFLAQMHDDVGIVGTSICTLSADFRHSTNYQLRYGGNPPYSHVQTMAYVLRKEVLNKLIDSGFYREERDSTKTLAIENYEIHLSQLVLSQGWNLRCLMPEFNGVDYRLPHKNPNPTSTVGDPNEVLGYFGRSAHPYETIFIKTNRDLYTEAYLGRMTYSMLKCFKRELFGNSSTSSIEDYLLRISSEAESGRGVVDFSFLPKYLEIVGKLDVAKKDYERVNSLISNMLLSTSWRITKPLRKIKDWLRLYKP